MKNDALGNRMKKYEAVTKYNLVPRSYTIIRVDGKAFHTYTKGLQRPFDEGLTEDMNATAEYLCANIQGAKFAYTQSDEISIFITDFDTHETQAWFDNEIQKMVSVSASLATAKFNRLRDLRNKEDLFTLGRFSNNVDRALAKVEDSVKLAHFDSRVFQVPTRIEAFNYLKWRSNDCIRNSVSSVAQANFSPKELHGKNQMQMKEMLVGKGIVWEDLPSDKKYGRITKKETYQVESESLIKGVWTFQPVDRTRWVTVPAELSPESWLELFPENT